MDCVICDSSKKHGEFCKDCSDFARERYGHFLLKYHFKIPKLHNRIVIPKGSENFALKEIDEN